jgi:hypothetical protein
MPVFAWRDEGKARKNRVNISDIPAEIRTEHFPYTGPERYCHVDALYVMD